MTTKISYNVNRYLADIVKQLEFYQMSKELHQ